MTMGKLTKSEHVPAKTIDKWLRWEAGTWILNSDLRALHDWPDDKVLMQNIVRSRRRLSHMKLPAGFSTWEELQATLVETGQLK